MNKGNLDIYTRNIGGTKSVRKIKNKRRGSYMNSVKWASAHPIFFNDAG